MYCLEKESKLIDLGITKYIKYEDVLLYINKVKDRVVYLTALEDYEREVPDEIVDIIVQCKEIGINNFYILHTDYTKEAAEKRDKKEKDPILFAVGKNLSMRSSTDENIKLYYVGDWVDEYCDLTLDKMIHELSKIKKDPSVEKIKIPENLEELKEELKWSKKEYIDFSVSSAGGFSL